MGIWSGIKHALNSTLGTNHFKPLDKIIQQQIKLSASDNVLYNMGSLRATTTNSNDSATVYYPNSFKMTTSGNFKFTGIASTSNTSTRIGRFYIYKNGEIIHQQNWSYTSEEFSPVEISFNVGDVFKFAVYVYNGSTTGGTRYFEISDMAICAVVIQSAFDII